MHFAPWRLADEESSRPSHFSRSQMRSRIGGLFSPIPPVNMSASSPHVEIKRADRAIEVSVDEVQAKGGAPVSEQPGLDTLRPQRLPQKRVVEQGDFLPEPVPVQCTSNEKVAGFLRDISITEKSKVALCLPAFLVRHRREAIASRFEVSPKIRTDATFDFCNSIGTNRTSRPGLTMSVHPGKQARRERLSTSQFDPRVDISIFEV
jgi:hypothetical protein